MAKRKKFAKKEFRRWLDALAALTVKTRDNFACRMGREGCSGQMASLDYNCQWAHIKSRNSNNLRWDILNAFTLCGSCHQWAHANPSAFGVWLNEHYSHIYNYVNEPGVTKTSWKPDDYRKREHELLDKLIDLKADPLHIAVYWRPRLIRALKRKKDDKYTKGRTREMNKEKILQVLNVLIDDCLKDVTDFDGREFNGKTLGELHGILEAKIKALAKIIKEILTTPNK